MSDEPTERPERGAGEGGAGSAGSLVGERLGDRYRIMETLGTGGIAQVYRADDEELGRTVAVKVLHDRWGGSEQIRGRFEREARSMGALAHPNIVSLIDYGVDAERPFLVMELMEGTSLAEVLEKEGPLEPGRADSIARQILQALQYAHARGVAHRDLKPENVFLQSLPHTDDHVKIVDFGFAKLLSREDDKGPMLSQPGVAFGTPAYIAPEQAAAQPHDHRADLYAAGVVVFEMLSGRRPFDGSDVEVLQRKVRDAAPSLASVRPAVGVEAGLEAWLARALARSPDGRFATAGEMLDSFEAIPRPLLGAGASRAVAGKRRVLAFVFVAAGAALLALVGGLSLLGRSCEPDEEASTPAASRAGGAAAEEAELHFEPHGPRDYWEGRTVEPELRAARRAVEAGEAGTGEMISALQTYARENQEDAAPLLLIGHLTMRQGLSAVAFRHYRLAHRVDSSARGDPLMLDNLVVMATHPSVTDQASRLIVEVYGAEALDAVDAALTSSFVTGQGATRLRALRGQLTTPP